MEIVMQLSTPFPKFCQLMVLALLAVFLATPGAHGKSDKDYDGFRDASLEYRKQSREFSKKAAAETNPEKAEAYQLLSENYLEMSQMKREADRLQRMRKEMDWTEYHKLQSENAILEKTIYGDKKTGHQKKSGDGEDAETRYRRQAEEARDQVAKEKQPERIQAFETLAANYEAMANMKKQAGELDKQGQGAKMDWSEYHELEKQNAELLKELAFGGKP